MLLSCRVCWQKPTRSAFRVPLDCGRARSAACWLRSPCSATVAEHNAGVAFALHQRALARRVVESAGVEGAVDLVAAHGHYGVGRHALADWLAGKPDAEELLADVYGVNRPRVLTAAALPATVMLPVWQRGLELVVVPRPDVVVLPHAHGLDELVTFQLTIPPDVELRAAGPRARSAFMLALRAEALASVVVAAAAVRRGARLARQFAEQRRQGGALIAEHPAVQELLRVPTTVLSGVSAEVLAHAVRPTSEDTVVSALSLSAGAHPRLADAANAALQVFGGLGYMRDTGLEKIVRDENHLRRYLASPAELSAVAARWERLHG